MTRRALTAVLFPLVFSSISALGQVLPFFTNTAQTVGFESNAFRTFSRVLVRNQLQIEGQEVPDPQLCQWHRSAASETYPALPLPTS